jgi:hypothetical protein
MSQGRLIAFSGYAGSGKSTAASFLQEGGYEIVKFAGPLKAMMRGYLDFQGLDSQTVEDLVEGSLKEKPHHATHLRTPRYFQQTLGTEWGRKLMGEDFWVRPWEARVKVLLSSGIDVVCDDCRFPNEAEAVRRLGGTVIQVVSKNSQTCDHASENPPTPDLVITNLSNLQRFERDVWETLLPLVSRDDQAQKAEQSDLGLVGKEALSDFDLEEIALRVLNTGNLEDAKASIRDYLDGEDAPHGVALEEDSDDPIPVPIRSAISYDELTELAGQFLRADAGYKSLVQFNQFRKHIGSYESSQYSGDDRRRLAFYIDARMAGVEATASEMDLALAASGFTFSQESL